MCFVSQGSGEDGSCVSDCCADLCDMDLVFCVTGGVVRMGFRIVMLTSVTWIVCFVSQGSGEDGVSDCCADLCDMDLGFCVTVVW